jgi:hypothetical protein
MGLSVSAAFFGIFAVYSGIKSGLYSGKNHEYTGLKFDVFNDVITDEAYFHTIGLGKRTKNYLIALLMKRKIDRSLIKSPKEEILKNRYIPQDVRKDIWGYYLFKRMYQ